MSFPAYPDYKHSGIELLPEYPSHWALKRFKNVFEERAERSSDGSEELLSVSAYFGVKPRSETLDEGDHLSRAESLEGYKVCRAGDLVINIMLAWNRGLGFSWQHGIVSPAYSVFHVTDGSYPKFLDYLVRSDEYIRYFKTHSAGIMDSRLRLYPESFGRLFSVIPPACEQTQIARFLDHETARIDALIEEQQRLIELLKEKRQAVISHAVTKGLDPTVPMKDSGVEWLGEVPAHWVVSRVKNVVSFITSGSRGWSDYIDESGEDIFLQSGDMDNRLNVLFDKAKRITTPEGAEGVRTRVREGDVFVCITGANTGRVAVVKELPGISYVNQHLGLLRPQVFSCDSRYLGYALSSTNCQTYFSVEQYGLKEGLSLTDLAEAPIMVPTIAEQVALVNSIEEQLSNLDRLSVDAERAVELLTERRSALISAAVTGKIDVRDWRPPVSTQPPNQP
ncbi:restriction endonuclease subunit S [Pseudomonas aeruginosa]|uniref:restriction endonuclease subunit S n=1 Tax=Pseudomonas aeruginosa TaxID=287 RepID=UPI0021F19D12|nr:restriction endonuclease subunit S [Pseudomonas aeruginosa]UYM62098.1 restriction endonuclease subunit S [Pseudomonas aeruginosa]